MVCDYRKIVFKAVVTAFLVLMCRSVWAMDPEGCQVCHRYRGLGRLDDEGETAKLFYVDPTYYDRTLGSHARLRCTDCHDRSEVEVVPHNKTSPVDCTKICHLESTSNLEVRFAHDHIDQMLQNSAHPSEDLEKCNQLLGSPLRADQSRCLLCHDEPTYRRSHETWAQLEAPVSRCNVCHDESLQVDTRPYYWHVHARSMPAHTNEEMIRLCAVCHSNKEIREEYELSDSTASYLASFHGKGALLGDETTAGCLDCHVGEMENVHQIQSHLRAGSSTSDEKLADTCRTPQCHPTAGKQVGSAAIHLDLSTNRSIEFFIAGIFVILIIFTFGPSVVLKVMDMLQIVIGRSAPSDIRNHHLAEKLMKDQLGRQLLKRFTPFQRVQHWILAITFAILVLTGYSMKFADRFWAAWLIEQIGSLSAARVLHRTAGALLLIGFVYHLIIYVGHFMIKERKRTGKNYLLVFLNLPMCMSPSDFKKMGQQLAYLFFLRKTRPKWGRFNLEEKFEYFGVLLGTILLGVTGILMWDEALTSRYLPGRVLTISYLVHSFESYLALLHVGIVHLAGVLLAPAAFPCSQAMFTGDTPTEELAEAHPEMLEKVEEEVAKC